MGEGVCLVKNTDFDSVVLGWGLDLHFNQLLSDVMAPWRGDHRDDQVCISFNLPTNTGAAQCWAHSEPFP